MNFEERCRLSEQCLPEAPYKEMLTKLHDEMLEALAQPQQEPVAKHYVDGGHLVYPPAQRKPLTDEEIIGWVESGEYNVITNDWASHIEFARAIEAAHGIKE